jgi:hypothetical protein
MSTTGVLYSSDATDDAVLGALAWSNPTYAEADDGSSATAATTSATDVQTHYLRALDYGASIPADATINGITVRVDRYRQVGLVSDASLRLFRGGGAVGDDKAALGTSWPWLGYAVATYGGAADLWGEAWTPGDINGADFGVGLSAYVRGNKGATGTAYVDVISVEVTYTDASRKQSRALLGVGW